jgi:hypothetical protein
MGLFSDLRKKKITAEMIQGATDAAKRLTPMVGDAYVTVTSTPTGTAIGLRDIRKNPRVGKEVAFGLNTKIAGQVGVYGVKIFSMSTEDSTGGARAPTTILGGAADGGSTGGVDAHAYNLSETKALVAEHVLSITPGSAPYIGLLTGDTNDDGFPIIVFDSFARAETDSPTAVGDTDEGVEDADTTSWSRATDGTPLTLQVMTRVAYFHGGDKKIYGYIREFKWDTAGLLLSVSGETRIEVEAPVTGCS